MSNIKVIGIDLGATNIRGAVVNNNAIGNIVSQRIKNDGSVEDVLNDIYAVVDALLQNDKASAIGIGVPSVVDVAEGIVYDVQYILSWKQVHLKKMMQERYNIPVYVNNDANCFAVGELYFGKGKGIDNLVGVTLGTGLGTGIIANGKLYAGHNCGAGEIGLFPYIDNILEYYCSGSFFGNVYGLDGVQVFTDAQAGKQRALELYAELGNHVGNAVKMIMYAYDPELIILGGSVSQAFEYFKNTMWQQVKTFAYSKTLERIKIEISELQNSGVIGAAALYYDNQK